MMKFSILFVAILVGLMAKEMEMPKAISVCPTPLVSSSLDSIPLRKTSYSVVVDAEVEGCTPFSVSENYYPFLVEFTSDSAARMFSRMALETQHSSEWYHIAESRKYGIAMVHFDDLRVLETPEFHKQLLVKITKRVVESQLFPNMEVRKTSSKQEIVDDLDASLYYNVMEKLTGVESFQVGGQTYTTPTRYTFSDEVVYSAAYIKQWFENYGCDEAFYQEFPYSGTTSRNVICVKNGSTRSDEIVVMGAHMDSISERSSTYAPGCIDNGSGTDAVMQAVKAFRNVTTSRTVHFIAFGTEEQGLVGSTYYVNNLASNGYNVLYALTMDMIGYSNRYFGVTIEGTSDPAISDLMDLVEDNMKEFASSLTINKSYFSFGSDHIPFQRAGIPAILGIEQDDTNYPGYHRTTDEIGYLNTDQAIQITRGLCGALYDLSM